MESSSSSKYDGVDGMMTAGLRVVDVEGAAAFDEGARGAAAPTAAVNPTLLVVGRPTEDGTEDSPAAACGGRRMK
jgi:hypothetical protein